MMTSHRKAFYLNLLNFQGEFDVKLTNYEACKAPKRKYCADVKAYKFNDVWLKFDVMMHENMTTLKVCIKQGTI